MLSLSTKHIYMVRLEDKGHVDRTVVRFGKRVSERYIWSVKYIITVPGQEAEGPTGHPDSRHTAGSCQTQDCIRRLKG